MKKVYLLLLLSFSGCHWDDGIKAERLKYDFDYSKIDCSKYNTSLVISKEEYCKNKQKNTE